MVFFRRRGLPRPGPNFRLGASHAHAGVRGGVYGLHAGRAQIRTLPDHVRGAFPPARDPWGRRGNPGPPQPQGPYSPHPRPHLHPGQIGRRLGPGRFRAPGSRSQLGLRIESGLAVRPAPPGRSPQARHGRGLAQHRRGTRGCHGPTGAQVHTPRGLHPSRNEWVAAFPHLVSGHHHPYRTSQGGSRRRRGRTAQSLLAERPGRRAGQGPHPGQGPAPPHGVGLGQAGSGLSAHEFPLGLSAR